MKLTVKQLRRIIKEETSKVSDEEGELVIHDVASDMNDDVEEASELAAQIKDLYPGSQAWTGTGNLVKVKYADGREEVLPPQEARRVIRHAQRRAIEGT